jgi:hypothetical protein
MAATETTIDGQKAWLVECPHCGGQAAVLAINCGVFRHATLRASGEAIPPHSPKTAVDELLARGAIDGCGGPFRFTGAQVEAADWAS